MGLAESCLLRHMMFNAYVGLYILSLPLSSLVDPSLRA